MNIKDILQMKKINKCFTKQQSQFHNKWVDYYNI